MFARLVLAFLFVLTNYVLNLKSVNGIKDIANIVHDKLRMINYDKVYLPSSFDNATKEGRPNPTIVKVGLMISSFGSIDVRDMEFSIEVILRQYWNDPRLKNLVNESRAILTDISYRIWSSDLYFMNSRRSKLHTVTKPNFFLWLNQNGDIIYSQKISLTLSCDMNLVNFPMDVQECFIKLGSFGYNLDELRLQWMYNKDHYRNVFLSNLIFLNEFHNPEIFTEDCQHSDDFYNDFACIQAGLKFSRKFNFYLLYTFMPCGLIVGIAWLSFFIEHEHIPGRVSLCLFALLSILTQSSGIMDSLPHVSYVKAIDIWNFTCLFFVVVALTEFCMIHFCCRLAAECKTLNEVVDEPDETTENEAKPQTDRLNSAKVYVKRVTGVLSTTFNSGFDENIGYKIDRIFRFLFPALFISFNIFYWSFYWIVNGIAMRF